MSDGHPVCDRDKKHIEINLGLACNNKCLFCLAGGVGAFVPFEQARAEAADHAARGFNSVGFIGGEPTLWPRIADLVRECTRLGYRHIHIISNGRRLADARFLDSLIHAGVTRFSVSIHSHDADVEDRLSGVPGGFREKHQALQNLLQRWESRSLVQKVSLNILLNKLNLGTLNSTLEFFGNMGFTEIRLLSIRPENRAMENFDLLVPRLTEVRRHFQAMMPVVRRYRLNIRVEPSPYCLFHDIPGIARLVARDQIDQVIHYDRNADREAFSWKERRATHNRVKAEFCARCLFDTVCEGVWRGYAERLGFEELHPVEDPPLSGKRNRNQRQ